MLGESEERLSDLVDVPVTIMTLSFIRLFFDQHSSSQWTYVKPYGPLDSPAIFGIPGIPSKASALGKPSASTLLSDCAGFFGMVVILNYGGSRGIPSCLEGKVFRGKRVDCRDRALF